MSDPSSTQILTHSYKKHGKNQENMTQPKGAE